MMKHLHHIARSGFSLFVALAIALPGVGFSAASNQAWAAAQQRIVNDPIPTTLEEAKVNLDLANALESEAAEEEAKTKAALDAAKAAYDAASSSHQAAILVVDQATNNANAKIDEIKSNAQAEYDAAYARVAEAVQENKAAQQAKSEAQANLSLAKADYDAAQQAYDLLANSGDAALQQASEKLREAEEAYDSAVTQYKDAFNAYKVANDERNETVASLNEAKKKVSACEAAVAAAQSKVDAAQKALDEAKSSLSTTSENVQIEALEAAVVAAQGRLDTAQGEKADAQNCLADAKSKQSVAQEAVIEAQAAFDVAKKDMGGVDIDALENAVKTAQEEYDVAKKAYDEGAQDGGVNKSFQQALTNKIAAENALEEAEVYATVSLQKYDAAVKELAAISAGGAGNHQAELSVKDFFSEQDSTAASSLFSMMGDALFTQSGSPGDIVDIEFVFRAPDLIENLNSIRLSIGLPDLRITDELMVYEAISLNFALTAQFSYDQSSPCELFAYSGDKTTDQDKVDVNAASNTTAEEVALAAAQRELESAKRDLEAALAEVEQLTDRVTELSGVCLRLNDKQIAIRDNVMSPARQASDLAKSEFYTIAKQTQEESDYRALYGAKNQLDHKRDAYNKIVWNMPELESNVEVAQRNEVAARDKLIAASDKLDAAKLLTLEGVMANPINEYNYADFLVLNDHAQNIKDAQALVPVAANQESAAKLDLDAAQAAYDAACAKHLTSIDDADEAKRIYESFLSQKDPVTTPDDSNNGTNGSEDDPSVEIWDSDSPNTSTADNENSGNKAIGSASVANEGNDQSDNAKMVSTSEVPTEESIGSNVANGRTITSKSNVSQLGIDPVVMVGIVGCCLLVAAGILVFLLTCRRRRADATGAVTADESLSGSQEN